MGQNAIWGPGGELKIKRPNSIQASATEAYANYANATSASDTEANATYCGSRSHRVRLTLSHGHHNGACMSWAFSLMHACGHFH